MKEIIEVKRTNGSCSKVVVGDVLNSLSEWLPANRRVIIIADANIHREYRHIVESYEYIIIGMGETNKTLQTYERIMSQLLEMNADRECFILGFGGGIVTDITGFVASTYMRGVRFGFIASTLLAQVDASVGGKNGVNLNGFKNMIGTFNQPDFVLCDTNLLHTLPDREFKAGLSEVIKAGIIADAELFDQLSRSDLATLKSDSKLLSQIITAAVRVKANIVEADERESGKRKKLNLGHTFAHAIEKCSRDFLHGEAVAIGTVIASELSVKMGMLADADAKRIRSLFECYELPTSTDVSMKKLLKALELDKKRDNNYMNMILPTKIGHCEIVRIEITDLQSLFGE